MAESLCFPVPQFHYHFLPNKPKVSGLSCFTGLLRNTSMKYREMEKNQ